MGLPKWAFGAASGGGADFAAFFAAGRAFSPKITHTRASSATYIDSTGAVAVGAANLILYSEDLSNAVWSAGGGASKAGSTLVLGPNVGAYPLVVQAWDPIAAGTYVLSVELSATGADIGRTVSIDKQGGFGGSPGRISVTLQAAPTVYQLPITGSGGWSAVRIIQYPDNTAENVVFGKAWLTRGAAAGPYYPTTSSPSYDVPRITYDPVTLACRGYLHEAQSTNLLLYSQEFDNAAWVKSNATVTVNAITAPDGTLTADSLLRAAGLAAYLVQGNGSAAGTYTISCWAKAQTTGNRVALRIQGTYPNMVNGIFDLVSGVVVNTESTGTASGDSAKIEPYPNGWYRCQLTGTLADAITSLLVGPCEAGDTTAGWEAPSATASDCYAWGAQLEANPAATSYIPTAGSQVTRAADIAYIDVATHLAGLDEEDSTYYAEFQATAHVGNTRVFGTGAVGETVIYESSTATEIGVYDGAATLGVAGSNYVTAPQKAATSLRSAAKTIALSGTAATDATNSHPAITQIYLGSANGGSNFFTGIYREIKVWKRGFSAAETEALTE